MAEDVWEARVALDEVEDGGDETHFVRRREVLLSGAFMIGVSSRLGAGASAVLELFGVVPMTTASMGEADVSVGVSTALLVDLAYRGVGIEFTSDLTTTGGDVFAEDA